MVHTCNSSTFRSEVGGLATNLRSSGTVGAIYETPVSKSKNKPTKDTEQRQSLLYFWTYPLAGAGWFGECGFAGSSLAFVMAECNFQEWPIVFRKSSLVISSEFYLGLLCVHE